MARVLLIRNPLESAYGGAEVQSMALLQGLRARGHEVGFLGSCPTLQRLCTEAGIAVTVVDPGPPPVTPWLAVSFLWRQWRMRRVLTTAIDGLGAVPDIVFLLALTEKLLLTGPLSARGVPVVWVEHDRLGRWLRQNPWLPRLRRLSRLATTVGVSELSRQLYLALGWPAERTLAIPNGIDVARFATVPDLQASDEPLRVGCIARLSPEKGVDVLLQAVEKLPGVRVDLVGTGPQDAEIRAKVASLNLQRPPEAQITLQAPGLDVVSFYQQIDVLVLPARDHDPYGLVVAEAMAAGRAVIVTDACGIVSQLQSGLDALVVPAGDAKALEQAIFSLVDPHRCLPMAQAARRTAQACCSTETMVTAYEALLTEEELHKV
jgi:glycosyltransferase involved in cell wall biosynthesis